MNSALPDISPEFVTKLDKTRQLSKKGGPYSRLERMKRRNEAIRLHFDEGCSILKIAEMLKVNRHTITKDIEFGYKELAEQWGDGSRIALRQIHRFEIQRIRLLENMNNQTGPQDLALEKMITDIDYKIGNMSIKIMSTRENLIKSFNDYIRKFIDPESRFVWVNQDLFQKVTKTTKAKIDKLIKEDIEDPNNFTFGEDESEEQDEENNEE